MSAVGDFLGDTIGGITGAKQAGEAGERAGQIQAEMSRAGIEEQRRQFDKLVELMSPYVGAGEESLLAQRDLLGLSGAEAQQTAIDNLEASPLFQSQIRAGEEALLQGASATGGLRGGNIQSVLAKYRPEMLKREIESQYSKLGGLTSLGQASAAGQASSGMGMASNIGNLLAQQGSALAGGQLARGGIAGQTFGDIASLGSMGLGAYKAGLF